MCAEQSDVRPLGYIRLNALRRVFALTKRHAADVLPFRALRASGVEAKLCRERFARAAWCSQLSRRHHLPLLRDRLQLSVTTRTRWHKITGVHLLTVLGTGA